jgi:GTP-binding protein
MKFIDEAPIKVAAGHGGRGIKSFRREKFVPFGGPDGGDGGHGGSVILVADTSVHTLLDFKFNPQWIAEDGDKGDGNNRVGKAGDDLIIKVPVGTQVVNVADSSIVCDLDEIGKQHILAKGGRGGRGNAYFKSSVNQVPEHCQPGEDGEKGEYMLSLKLVADIGLIGFPNAGKSTLISRISAAKPKIADYPFTTLVPNLGVVKGKGRSFVVADIPGLIPGASEGRGLGIKFLKHVERTKALVHLINPDQLNEDGTPCPPLEAYKLINKELKLFSPDIANRPQIVVLTKSDIAQDKELLEKTVKDFKKKKIKCFIISAATGQGLPELLEEVEDLLMQRQKAEQPDTAAAGALYDF